MNNTMVHRGPDDVGYYCAGSVGLGVRRLSIIDLSTGHQPIANEDGTIHVAYNGEIYNFEQLRAQLEQKGHVFHTRSDTEVIIHAYEEYGSACVEHFNGMFAFAVWDERRQRLLLARDRLGIKPLFYHVSPHRLLFASELKAILAHPHVPRDINLLALDQFLALEYIPAPATIFEHIHKLPPGHLLIWEQGRVRIEQYWDIPV
ncbi:MAG: asparagine synthetase B family protein, partial [Chloroflexota bacterium]